MFLFKRKPVTCVNFIEMHFPIITHLADTMADELLETISDSDFVLSRSKEEFRLEIVIFVDHILGKAMFQVNDLRNPYTPEMHKISIGLTNKLYEKYASGLSGYSKPSTYNKYMLERCSVYQTFEQSYSKSEILKDDFERNMASLLLGTAWETEIPAVLQDKIVEFHRRITITMFETLKKFQRSFKLVK